MVENDEKIVLNSSDVSQHVPVWFAKAFCFVRYRKSSEAVFENKVLVSKLSHGMTRTMLKTTFKSAVVFSILKICKMKS